MLLVVDVGNTSTTFGIYKDAVLIDNWRLASEKNKSEDEYGILLKNIIEHKNLNNKIKSAIVSSVVLPLTDKFKEAIERYLNVPVLILSPQIDVGIKLEVKNPEEVGGDRIANTCAAYNLYKKTAVVVDFGTATTFDIVTSDREFIGGIIAPGIGISAEALSSFTSLLPKVNISMSNSVIGKTTVDNMLSGIVRGHAAMIDGLIYEIEKEIGQSVITIATGGYTKLISGYLRRPFDYINPHLTLEGLRIIYNLNKSAVSLQI
jgi:type III pantothenate kinase